MLNRVPKAPWVCYLLLLHALCMALVDGYYARAATEKGNIGFKAQHVVVMNENTQATNTNTRVIGGRLRRTGIRRCFGSRWQQVPRA